MPDLVIDTCVICHARDKRQGEKYRIGILFFEKLIDADSDWCVDEGIDFDESQNRSKILSEYWNRTVPGDLGREVFTQMAGNGRVRIEPKPPRAVCKKIEKEISDPTDRVFAQVAAMTDSHYLISHDRIFGGKCRIALKSKLQITICDVVEAYGII